MGRRGALALRESEGCIGWKEEGRRREEGRVPQSIRPLVAPKHRTSQEGGRRGL